MERRRKGNRGDRRMKGERSRMVEERRKVLTIMSDFAEARHRGAWIKGDQTFIGSQGT